MQGEIKLLLLLRILNNKRGGRQEAPSFATLKQRRRVTIIIIYICNKLRENFLTAVFQTYLFQPVCSDDWNAFGQSTKEFDSPAHFVSHKAVHVSHTFSHAAA